MEELSVDQAVNMLNGVQDETPSKEVEQVEEVVEEIEQEETIEEQQEEEQEESEQPVDEEEKPADLTQKVKFKANGEDVERSIQDLINDAQLASNYNQKMQELANQRKAFELANQKPVETIDPLKQFEELNNNVTARAMKMLGIVDPEEFMPDAMGVIGNKTHYAAYQKALIDIQQEQQQESYSKQQEQAIEDKYISTVQTLGADPNFQEINKYAEQALFQLPTKGAEGIKQFQTIYATYQKVMARDQYNQEMQLYGRSNVQVKSFTNGEVDALASFYNDCKEEFNGTKTKEQVKAKVPKSVPIKVTVKTETPVKNEAPTARKLDMKKIQSMDLADIAKLL